MVGIIRALVKLIFAKKARGEPPADDSDDLPFIDSPLKARIQNTYSLVLLLQNPYVPPSGTLKSFIDENYTPIFKDFSDGEADFLLSRQRLVTILGSATWLFGFEDEHYALTVSDKPYDHKIFSWPSVAASPQIRELCTKHQAWIRIQNCGGMAPDERDSVIFAVGEFVSFLDSPDVLAFCAPELEVVNSANFFTRCGLYGDAPLSIFDGTHSRDNVIMADPDNENMKAATAQAKARWPEFVEAFKNAQNPEQVFAVKAQFGVAQDSEVLWVKVSTLSNETIGGLLASKPHFLEDYHFGQSVELDAESIVDFMYINLKGEQIGGWTDHVLTTGKL